MRNGFFLIVCGLLLICLPLFGQGSPGDKAAGATPSNTQTEAEHGLYTSGFTVLTKNIGQGPGGYPQNILIRARRKWYPKITDLQKSADMRRGTTVVEFEIKADGSIEKMRTVKSAGSDALDEAVRQAITSSSPFGPLPEPYRKGLKLQMEFRYMQPENPETPFCNGTNWGAHPAANGVLHQMGHGVKPPHATYSAEPEYSEEARRAKYQSEVKLAGTVDPDGTFTDLCLSEAAGFGLDQKAFEAVRTWKFQPAILDGQPVPVRIEVETSFHLY